MSGAGAGARLGHLAHLARRFAGSLSARPPEPVDETWALGRLSPGEAELWRRMAAPDRRHAVGVARRVVETTGADVEPWVVTAALLHDAGKLASGLGTFGRVGATVWAGVRGHQAAARGDGRVARYLRHDALGAQLLQAASSDPRTVAWAAEHHRPRASWTVPADLGDVLKAADDD